MLVDLTQEDAKEKDVKKDPRDMKRQPKDVKKEHKEVANGEEWSKTIVVSDKRYDVDCQSITAGEWLTDGVIITVHRSY